MKKEEAIKIVSENIKNDKVFKKHFADAPFIEVFPEHYDGAEIIVHFNTYKKAHYYKAAIDRLFINCGYLILYVKFIPSDGSLNDYLFIRMIKLA